MAKIVLEVVHGKLCKCTVHAEAIQNGANKIKKKVENEQDWTKPYADTAIRNDMTRNEMQSTGTYKSAWTRDSHI